MANKEERRTFSASVKSAWSKFAGSVGKTYDKTVHKAEDTLEANRIRSRLKELEQSNEALYARIGMEVYRSAREQIDRADFAAQIDRIQQNYAEQRQLLLRQMMLGEKAQGKEGQGPLPEAEADAPPAPDSEEHPEEDGEA